MPVLLLHHRMLMIYLLTNFIYYLLVTPVSWLAGLDCSSPVASHDHLIDAGHDQMPMLSRPTMPFQAMGILRTTRMQPWISPIC
jgi:hypothetical protein